MNTPNKLTCLRVILVPIFMFFILYDFPCENGAVISGILAAVMFALASFTDFLDGKIARKYNLVTDFGKFVDPLADKFMIFGAILAFIGSDRYASGGALKIALIIGGTVVIFRELAVTSLRLVVSNSEKHIVIAASIWGKLKTASQCAWVLSFLIEPLLWSVPVLSWITIVLMTVLTVFSGVDYIKNYWQYLDSNK